MAACYALTFQHAAVGQDPTGFWIMIRMIATLNFEVWAHDHRSRFGEAITPDVTLRNMSKNIVNFPPLRHSLIQEGIEAISKPRLHCQGSLELRWYGVISDASRGLLVSSLQVRIDSLPSKAKSRSS